jgi:hypothetical protein
MNWEHVESQLAEAPKGTPRRFGESAVVVPFETPFPLWEAVEAALTEDESEEHVGLESWPGDVEELLTAEGALVSLLSYDWEGGPGTTSGAGLDIVGRGARRYLCWWDEVASYRAIAAMEPWDDPAAVSATVASFIATNGAAYGIYCGSQPDDLTNYQPRLLPEELLRQAFADFHESEGGSYE